MTAPPTQDQASTVSAKPKDFDPAALLIAVIAAVIGPLLAPGLWSWLDTLVTAVVLLALVSYSLTGANLRAMTTLQRIASWIVIGLIFSMVAGWPVQQLIVLPHWKFTNKNAPNASAARLDDMNADRATLVALLIVFVIIGIVAIIRLFPRLARHFGQRSSNASRDTRAPSSEMLTRIAGLEQENQCFRNELDALQERVKSLERKNGELGGLLRSKGAWSARRSARR